MKFLIPVSNHGKGFYFYKQVSNKVKGLKVYRILPNMVQIHGYVYLLVNTLLRNALHLQMLYRQLLDQQAAPLTILNSGTKSLLTKAIVQLVPFLDQTNTITGQNLSCSHQTANLRDKPLGA